MPSNLSAAMLAEMQGLDRVVPVAEVTFSSLLRFAEEPVAAASKGLYLPYVQGGFGAYDRVAAWADFSLSTPRTTITIFDKDRVLQKDIGGASKAEIRGSAWQNFLRSDHVGEADHYKFFDGIVVDHSARGRLYSFAISPDTRLLNTRPKIPKASKLDWPDMPNDFVGTDLWVVYGEHNSDGIADSNGMIECIPAKEETNGDVDQWICSYGQLTEITNLFVNGLSDFANWGFGPVQRGGNYYQIAIRQSGTPSKKSTKITIDAKGLFDTTPISGTFISNPAAIIRHFLTNFVFGDGSVIPSAAWESETGKPVASSIFDSAATFFADRGMRGAKVIKASDTGASIFNAWCNSHSAIPFWSDQWKLAAMPIDPSKTAIYAAESATIREKFLESLDDPGFDTSAAEPFTDLSVNSVLDDVRSALVESRRFVNRPGDVVLTGPDLDILFGESKLQIG